MVERVAILGGTGRMGQWFARFFKKQGYQVIIGGRSLEKSRAVAERLRVDAAASNAEAARGADIIVVSTTLETTFDTIQAIKNSVKTGAIVFDIASVKGRIIEALKELSSKGARAISIHPMFGPGADTFSGQKVILIPVTEDRALTDWAVDLFTREGAHVHVVRSGEEHDRFVAITLSLTHFLNIVLGRVLMDSDIREIKKFAGTTFSLQLTLVEAVLSQDPDLYYGIESLNPEFRQLLEKVISTVQETSETLDHRDIFVRNYLRARESISKDPQYASAYERFYKAVRASVQERKKT